MRKLGSWSKAIESKKTALLMRLGRPKTLVQLVLVICVSYFLLVSSSRHTVDNSDNNEIDRTEIEDFKENKTNPIVENQVSQNR